MTDIRTRLGLRVIEQVVGPFSLRPAQHMAPETDGMLDCGLMAFTTEGQEVLIGELFAIAPVRGQQAGVRLNTKAIGEQIVVALNKEEKKDEG